MARDLVFVLVAEDSFAVSRFHSVSTRSPFFPRALVGRLSSAGSAFCVFPPLFVDVIAVLVFLTFPLFLVLPSVNATSPVSVAGFPSFASLADVLVPATVFPSTAFVVARVVCPFFVMIGVSGEGIVVVRMRVDAALLGDDFRPLAGFFFGGISQGKAQPV